MGLGLLGCMMPGFGFGGRNPEIELKSRQILTGKPSSFCEGGPRCCGSQASVHLAPVQ